MIHNISIATDDDIMREFEKEPEELMFNIGLTKQHRTHSGLTGVTS